MQSLLAAKLVQNMLRYKHVSHLVKRENTDDHISFFITYDTFKRFVTFSSIIKHLS